MIDDTKLRVQYIYLYISAPIPPHSINLFHFIQTFIHVIILLTTMYVVLVRLRLHLYILCYVWSHNHSSRHSSMAVEILSIYWSCVEADREEKGQNITTNVTQTRKAKHVKCYMPEYSYRGIHY